MIWIHKPLLKPTDHHKSWNDRITETRCKINKGYLTILGTYTPEKERYELSNDFHAQL
jgi:hypothetical protein